MFKRERRYNTKLERKNTKEIDYNNSSRQFKPWGSRVIASQNGAITHINRSIYSIETTSKSCLQLFIAVFLFCEKKKSKNDGAIRRNMLFMDPVWDSFPFYMRTVQSRTGTKISRVRSATDTKSDRSEFVFRPIPCKPRMKRNVWRAIRTHNGPSSSRSHVFTLPCSAAHDPLASGWHMKGAVSRQSSSFCLILPITRHQ